MAAQSSKSSKIIVQGYPRIENTESKDDGLLNDRELAEHKKRVPFEDLRKLLKRTKILGESCLIILGSIRVILHLLLFN